MHSTSATQTGLEVCFVDDDDDDNDVVDDDCGGIYDNDNDGVDNEDYGDDDVDDDDSDSDSDDGIDILYNSHPLLCYRLSSVGMYTTPTIAGSRSGGLIAQCKGVRDIHAVVMHHSL